MAGLCAQRVSNRTNKTLTTTSLANDRLGNYASYTSKASPPSVPAISVVPNDAISFQVTPDVSRDVTTFKSSEDGGDRTAVAEETPLSLRTAKSHLVGSALVECSDCFTRRP